MSRDSDRAQELFSELLAAVCRDTGLREELAMPYVISAFAYLQAVHGGRKLYIPAPERKYPADEIIALYEKTGDADHVCRKFNIGRTKLFSLVNRRKKKA